MFKEEKKGEILYRGSKHFVDRYHSCTTQLWKIQID